MTVHGVRFNDHVFSEPVKLRGWVPPRYAGLFAILVRDPNWAPRPFQALYFGEFGNNAHELQLPDDQIRLAGRMNADLFFIAELPMLFSTTAQRTAVCDQLVRAYNPIWQTKRHSSSTELAEKLSELEKKHEEQTTQVQLLLAALHRYFGPQPEPIRRRFGFVAQPEKAC
jgi:hypothetical protein